MTIQRSKPRIVALLTAAILLILGIVATPQAGANPNAKTLSVVVMGDSYSAGNGAGSYFGPVDSFRSRNNYGHRYVDWLNRQGVHATLTTTAWSGNTTVDVVGGQIRQLPADADLVLFTIGGNDGNFGEIVSNCFALGMRSAQGCKARVAEARELINDTGPQGFRQRTENVLRVIDKRLARSEAEIVLIGYPHLSLPDPGYILRDCVRWQDSFCVEYVHYSAVNDIRRLADEAAAVQQALVDSWNRNSDRKVHYVNSIRSRFASHEPDPSVLNKNDYRWLNEFFETEGQRAKNGTTESRFSAEKMEWYHPNKIGHDEIAAAIREQIGVPDNAQAITPKSGNVDIVFAIDTTGSMVDDIDVVRANVTDIMSRVSEVTTSARFALVTYQDFPEAGGSLGDYPARVDHDFTSDSASLRAALDSLVVGGGGDYEEAVYSGIAAALDLDWRPGVKKMTIVLGDAPPKDPEPITGHAWQSIAQRAYEIDPVEVYGVDTAELASEPFTSLVEASGGQVLKVSDVADIPQAIVDTVDDVLAKPFAWIQGPYTLAVGEEVTLDGRASYAVTGELVKFEWDLDGDGVFERESSGPEITHAWTAPFSGTIGLRVTDSAGLVATGSTQVDVSDDGDGIPAADDNCPAVANHGQGDEDGDGIGNECDDTPGYPTEDMPHVSVVDQIPPTPTPQVPIKPSPPDTGAS